MSNLTVKFANVEFKETPGTMYCFLTDMKVLKRGDKVVVDTRIGLKVATFKGYTEEFPLDLVSKARWIVQKVDVEKLKGFDGVNVQKVIQQNSAALKKRELAVKADELAKQLREIQQQISEL